MSCQPTKSGSGRSAPTGIRRSGEAAFLQPHSQSGLDPEELAAAAGHQEKRKRSSRSDRHKALWLYGIASAV
ncbi:hypothetical protein [Planococcus soli]|uniref:hypothetical protein n=1 Tax=Planococcus soli TaxID=2666072 RepID=UPI00115D7C04|nr:hypothetical protein [Planococcus soli]